MPKMSLKCRATGLFLNGFGKRILGTNGGSLSRGSGGAAGRADAARKIMQLLPVWEK
jgi:hypothetical protein